MNDSTLIQQGYRSMDHIVTYMFDTFPDVRNALGIYDRVRVCTKVLSGTLKPGPNSKVDDFRRLLVASIQNAETLTGKPVSE